jgi:hypothetical protein
MFNVCTSNYPAHKFTIHYTCETIGICIQWFGWFVDYMHNALHCLFICCFIRQEFVVILHLIIVCTAVYIYNNIIHII